jgi:hypothetical protein
MASERRLITEGTRTFCCNTALGDAANRIAAGRKTAGNASPGNPSELQAGLRYHVLPGLGIVSARISSIGSSKRALHLL